MRYRPTILNISSVIFLTWIMVYTYRNSDRLTEGAGWGFIYMVGLAGIGLVAWLVDLLLQIFLKSQVLINIIGLIITIGLGISIIVGRDNSHWQPFRPVRKGMNPNMDS